MLLIRVNSLFPSPFGAYILKSFYIIRYNDCSNSFRPLSGLIFLNMTVCFSIHELNWFPSPFGAYILKLFNSSSVEHTVNRFPSPFGAYILKYSKRRCCFFGPWFPSPFGAYILKFHLFGAYIIVTNGFRPLSGLIFLNE